MKRYPLAISAALALLSTLALPPAAEARDRGGVTVCRNYGNGCYRAPVRRGKWGRTNALIPTWPPSDARPQESRIMPGLRWP